MNNYFSFSKTLFAFLLIVGLSISANAQTPIWGQPNPTARLTQISVGNVDNIWGVNAEGRIWQWLNTTKKWTEPRPSARLKQIAATLDGTVWGVNAANDVWSWNGTTWIQIKTDLKIKCIAAGSGMSVIALDESGAAWRYNVETQKFVELGSDDWYFKQIAIGSDNAIWAINEAGNVFKLEGPNYDGAWVEPEPKARLSYISVADANTVRGVNSLGKAYTQKGGKWVLANTPELKCISVGTDGEIWGLNSRDEVFRVVK